ncbi:hypothetical protein KP509_15G041000 [Ceratopteris richardii]|uniref:TIR domain-containing protein n=1 Tax=Ceratopteris richardii TaxID=49495 RepID=A0A8T2T7H0_CERRI|nr:hypothetical protein KP509_15G041000 [Ceratopteris richardii]
MSAHYDVFICHRGTETKRNLVSVLNGMLGLKGITSFVDYEMTEGTRINPAIEDAIKNSYVHIVILSPEFANSKWCLEELFQIMSMQSSAGTSHRPRKVIPIFCDGERSMLRERAVRLSYNVNRSSPEERKRWGEAVESLCNFSGFEYNSNVTLQWEKLSEFVVEVEDFLKGVDSRSSILPEQGHQRRSPAQDYEVFLCYIGSDTKHNMVSVLRGMLHWEGITCFNDYDMNDESTEIKPHIEDAIQKSKVYVIFLSPKFASSKLCLEEVYQIMDRQNSPGTSNTVGSVIPVFYDVTPADVRHQKSSYDLCRVSEGTADEIERWSKSLSDLSVLKGLEFESKTMFQWEGLEKIVKAVKTCLKEPISKNLYGKQLDEVQKVLESKISADVILIEEEGTACSVLQGCYGLGRTYLEVLRNRCLIGISDNWSRHDIGPSRIIEVHDQIRDMGRRIVREEKRDRAWDEETAENILKDEKARSTLRGLSISSDFSFPKEATKCRSLPHLEILVVKQGDDRELNRDEGIWAAMFPTKNFLERVRCEELRWLKWRRAPFRDVPLGMCSKKLRVLDLEDSEIRRVPNIRSLTNFQRIEGLQSLELLNLTNCNSLRTLTSFATTLRTLHLSYCESLESLKASSSLPNLRDLRLYVCHKLKELDCEGCGSLEHLFLFHCDELERLQMPSLPNLRRLDVWWTKLKEVDCGGCGSLEHLDLRYCFQLERLQMPSLPNLRRLDVWWTIGLKEVDCGGCGSLEHLFLYSCNGLERLQMPSLPNLRRLDVWWTIGLKEVDCGGLPSLQNLSVVECASLKRISVLPRSLETLRLQKCRQLQVLDGLDTLTNLRGVRIVECFHIAEESLPENIKRLPRLPDPELTLYSSSIHFRASEVARP